MPKQVGSKGLSSVLEMGRYIIPELPLVPEFNTGT
jgi:hypothetical protein